MRIIRAGDLARACPMAEAIAAVRDGFAALSSGEASVPLRTTVPLREAAIALAMPAALRDAGAFAVKIVSVVPANAGRGLPAVTATVLLSDAATGLPLALLDGTALTALRTGAAGGVAADLLGRADASVMALYGTGAQARAQLQAALAVRRLREVRVVGRDPSRLAAFVEAVRAEIPGVAIAAAGPGAAAGADLVVTATSSVEPVFPGRLLGPGAHVTAVGSFRPDMRELDDDALGGARVFVDQREAALAEAGELRHMRARDVTEIGEVLAGRAAGRRTDRERTIFKSVGNAIQDLVVASHAYERALALGLGEEVAFP